MQDEGPASLGIGAQVIINADAFPMRKPFWLAVGQTCAHRKIGLGQKKGVFVVSAIGHGNLLLRFLELAGAKTVPALGARVRVPGR